MIVETAAFAQPATAVQPIAFRSAVCTYPLNQEFQS
jgi:hypothetical protein